MTMEAGQGQAFEVLISELKKLTLDQSTVVEHLLEYYEVNFCENPKLMIASEVIDHSEALFMGIAAPVLVKQVDIKLVGPPMLSEIMGTEFVHGFCNLSNGGVFLVYYFNEVGIGCVIIPELDGRTRVYRMVGVMNDKVKQNQIIPSVISGEMH